MVRAYLLTGIGGFAVGIAWRSLFPATNIESVGVWALPAFFLVLAASFVATWFLCGRTGSALLLGALVFFAGALGVVRFDESDRALAHTQLPERVLGTDITARGVIIDEPDTRLGHTFLVVRLGVVQTKNVLYKTETRIRALVPVYGGYQYGDEIIVRGALEEPEQFKTDTGRSFDYVEFLKKDGIVYQSFYPEVEVVGSGKGNPVRAALFSFKHSFLEHAARVLPEPHTSLLGGLVVGAKESLGEKWLDWFRATGIIHIVVLSGYNVTIVAEAIMRFLAFVPRTARLVVASGAITGFMLMVGASATVVRATVMALIVILARLSGRMYEIGTALALAGLVMLAINPRILLFDPSFQLSFLATIGLIYLAPFIERRLGLLPTKLQLREFATATIATQLFVLPLLLYSIGEFSVVAVPVNMLVLIAVPAVMLVGFLAGVFAMVHTALAWPFALAAYGLLSYILAVISLFAALPIASFIIPPFPAWLMVAAYTALSVFLIWGYKTKKPQENWSMRTFF